MRSIIATLTFGAVLVFILAPSLVDGIAHCLGHDDEVVITAPASGPSDHGVHHQDCYWLKGKNNSRAVLFRNYPLAHPTGYAPWVSPAAKEAPPVNLITRSGRAPPPVC